jgi:hypothetical protein
MMALPGANRSVESFFAKHGARGRMAVDVGGRRRATRPRMDRQARA